MFGVRVDNKIIDARDALNYFDLVETLEVTNNSVIKREYPFIACFPIKQSTGKYGGAYEAMRSGCPNWIMPITDDLKQWYITTENDKARIGDKAEIYIFKISGDYRKNYGVKINSIVLHHNNLELIKETFYTSRLEREGDGCYISLSHKEEFIISYERSFKEGTSFLTKKDGRLYYRYLAPIKDYKKFFNSEITVFYAKQIDRSKTQYGMLVDDKLLNKLKFSNIRIADNVENYGSSDSFVFTFKGYENSRLKKVLIIEFKEF